MENKNNTYIYPDDPAYESERHVFNSSINRYPKVICICNNSEEVSRAIDFAQNQNLQVAVKGGGHNLAANHIIDGCLLISTRGLKNIEYDPKRNVVTVGAGVINGELQKYLKSFGKITVGGDCPQVGIAGYTLGGGFGPFARLFGLACDNLVSAELMLPKKACLTVSEDQHPNIFWSLKGGGGKIGVISSLTFKLYPRPSTVLEGTLIWPFSKAKEIVNCFLKINQIYKERRELYLRCHFRREGEQAFVGVDILDCGSLKDHEKILAPFYSIGEPIIVDLKHREPLELFFGQKENHPKSQEVTWKSGFFKNDVLDEEVISRLIEGYASCPNNQSFLIIDPQGGGAISEVDNSATPYPHRSSYFCICIFGSWTNEGEKVEREVKHWLSTYHASLSPWFTGLVFYNYAEPGIPYESGVYFGQNQSALDSIKKSLDPDHLFL